MPQMAPLLWLYLYFFFLVSLMLILILNFFIKPFEIMSSLQSSKILSPKSWKL
uniref:ATP synthase F0 subunit 8 n=1 Tax=Atergatis integerrimus TaxID=903645 RepID=A0A343UMC5_ATEIN|nr:ATP synthase F0 subunit 8 [Atergatis integerrimus]AVA09734.1 ATP synthase F0 subunit 8 [Atergatis integerrimus]AVE15425.1 ATP synthase F0 subunit 8 [Atergatis integerrimus]